MSRIAYDPVKDAFAGMIRGSRWLRSVFFMILNLFFLRSWHIRKWVRRLHKDSFAEKKEWKVLDAGSGFGQYDRFLLNEFDNAVIDAIDVKDSYLEDCRNYFERDIRQSRITFRKKDLLELNIRNRFDFVLCVDVMEHIDDDILVLKNIGQALKNGGYFLMHSPSHLSGDDAEEGEGSFVDEHARTGYSYRDIDKKLRDSGFTPLDIRYTYRKWGHASWVIMIKWPMLLLNKAGIVSALLLPFYYAVFLLPGLILMGMDLPKSRAEGNGIIVLAKKAT